VRGSSVLLLLVFSAVLVFPEVQATPVHMSFYLLGCNMSSVGRIPVNLDVGDKIQGSFNLSGPISSIEQVSFSILTEGGLGTVYQLNNLSVSNLFNFTANPTGYSFAIQSNHYLLDFGYGSGCSGVAPRVAVDLSFDISRHFDWWLIVYVGLGTATATGLVYWRWYRPRRAPQKKLENWTNNRLATLLTRKFSRRSKSESPISQTPADACGFSTNPIACRKHY